MNEHTVTVAITTPPTCAPITVADGTFSADGVVPGGTGRARVEGAQGKPASENELTTSTAENQKNPTGGRLIGRGACLPESQSDGSSKRIGLVWCGRKRPPSSDGERRWGAQNGIHAVCCLLSIKEWVAEARTLKDGTRGESTHVPLQVSSSVRCPTISGTSAHANTILAILEVVGGSVVP